MKKALLVGGKQQLLPVLTKKLSEHHDIGVAAWWEVDGDAKAKLPAGCDLVIMLIDMISHPLQDKVVAIAKAESVPFIRAEGFRWSSMSAALLAKGYKPAALASEAPPVKEAVSKEKLVEYYEVKKAKDLLSLPLVQPPRVGVRLSRAEALRRLREYLEKHPNATNQEVNRYSIEKAKAEIPGLITRAFRNCDIATVRRELIEAAQNAARPVTPAVERAEEPAAEVSVETEKVAVKDEPEKGTPAWYTEDFKAALALLRVEMLKASITEITNLDADSFEYKRVEIVRGKL